MDSFEFTKIFGALLTAGLVASLSGFITSKIYPEHRGEVRTYLVAATEAAPQGAPGAAEAPAETATGVAVLLAAADPAAGAKAVKKCTACHSLNQGGKHRLGPNLWDLIGRPVASAVGYKYSKALKGKSGETWSYDNLDAFLTKPKGWVPGTKMAFAGLKKPERRADLIAHLRSLSDSPAALPE
jgi:cytochrome c